jgi:hypothetical protein
MAPTRALHTRLLLPAIALVALALPASAFGQATRTWVSGVGDDANPCSRTAPCKTFAGAISKTAISGEINVLDPGGFGALTITKSITVDADNTEAGVLVSGTNGITVAAGAADKVNLRGLDFNGVGSGVNGIRVTQVGRLKVQNSKIYNFTQNGIDFNPGNNGAKLDVQNTRIHNNGGNGVMVAPANGAATATATLRNVQAIDNACGATASSTGEGTAFATNCGTPAAPGINANAIINEFHSAFNDNAGFGITSRGSKAFNRISDNEVTGNFQGLVALDGGQIISWKNNFVDGNGTNGGPTTTITPAKKSARKSHKRKFNR